MENLWNFKIGDEQDAEADGFVKYETSRDLVVFLIDAEARMFECESDVEKSLSQPESASCFDFALEVVRTFLCKKCASGEQEYVAVVFLNTEKSKNEQAFDNLFLFQEAGLPGAERVKELERLISTAGDEDDRDAVVRVRSDLLGAGSGLCKWDEALWLAGIIAENSEIRFGLKRIFLFTLCDDPSRGDQNMRKRIGQKIEDLRNQNISLQLLPPSTKFDRQLWDRFLDKDDRSSEAMIAEFLDEWGKSVRRKEVKRRSMGNVSLSLGHGVELTACLYNLVAQARVPPPVYLDRKRNEEVKTVTSYFNADTGEKLLDQDMVKIQTYGGVDIAFDSEEVESLRRLCEPGLVLLGFKSDSELKLYHHVRPALFLHPNDNEVRGSVCLFRALVERCGRRRKMAVCRLTARRNMAPRLVYLLPQREGRNEQGELLRSLGFHVLFMPFADDIRDLSKIVTESLFSASRTQVELAKAVVSKLTASYHPDMYKNPVLEKHYKVVELMALDHDEPPPEVADQTKPDFDRVRKRAGQELERFVEAVFPAGYQEANSGADSSSAKRKRNTNQTSQPVDLEVEWRANKLEKLTVGQLKQGAATSHIHLTATKKADIIKEIARALADN